MMSLYFWLYMSVSVSVSVVYVNTSFPLATNDLDIVISHIDTTLQVVTIQQFLVLVFDTDIGRLCAFKEYKEIYVNRISRIQNE